MEIGKVMLSLTNQKFILVYTNCNLYNITEIFHLEIPGVINDHHGWISLYNDQIHYSEIFSSRFALLFFFNGHFVRAHDLN